MPDRLTKNQKLKSEVAIQLLFSNGKSVFSYPLKIQYMIEAADTLNPNPGFLFGVSVSKKYFKRAVDRNELKRKMRESFRLQKAEMEENLLVQQKVLKMMFLYIGKTKTDYVDISEASRILLHKLNKKISR